MRKERKTIRIFDSARKLWLRFAPRRLTIPQDDLADRRAGAALGDAVRSMRYGAVQLEADLASLEDALGTLKNTVRILQSAPVAAQQRFRANLRAMVN